ncbi:response regulator [Modestobacter sp. VKM Ac-2986]|uniref:hybrid sensor histidine kinase/response regulator n=1 Tax=Modestobacter sp. VKM Ac-2986 TaxID=3004140 RepID=UPI0022AB53DF|nr:response regulator [Modestobacter sp. VKM Ac-2986]MCZ2830891.1 response regulator [Modestobacter sp. VKM Ac-2986]
MPLQTLMRRPARVGLAALVAVMTTVVALNLVVAAFLMANWSRAGQVLVALQDGHVAMLNQETGLRGFLITRDPQFLEPYRQGAADMAVLDAQMIEWSEGDEDLRYWVDQLHVAEQAWVEQWATPVQQVQPGIGDGESLTALLLQDKALFDRYREVEAGAREVLTARREAAIAQTRLVLATGTAVGIGVAVAVALVVRRVNRRVSDEVLPPIQQLRDQLSDLAQGDVDRAVAPTGPVELREMATDVNTLSDALRLRGEQVSAREEQLVAARDEAERAGQAKTAFLATMSHEIRTPLNAVLGLTDLLLTTELTELQRGHLETVSRSGDSLLTLINDVLDFSKIEAGELDLDEAPFDLAELVYDVGQLFAGAAGAKAIDLLVDVRAAEGRQLIGDGLRLRQVLMNLVSNAVKFTPRGHVVVRVTGEVRHDVLHAQIAVLDTGIGIPDEHRHRLFRSFSQVDGSTTRVYGGTGLGLAISQRIVQAMGGEITVDSEVAVGSTFTIHVGLQLGTAEDEVPPAVSLAGYRVLAVDDNRTNLDILEHQLTRAGATVVLADSPAQALYLLGATGAGHGFDVCVLDQHMPGTSGDELARRMRDTPATAGLPLVLLSSSTTVPVGTAGLFDARLHKPVHPDRLLRTLWSLVRPGPVREPATSTGPVATGHEGASLHVLIAEDHEVNAQLMQLYLRQLGHTSERVADGRAAVDAVRAGRYDVVLMDAQMPVLGGADATAEIRALPGHRPVVIAVTASVLASDRAAFLAAGADDFLTKPVRLAVLDGALGKQFPGAVAAAAVQPAPVTVPADVLDREVVEELHDLGEEGFQQVYTRFADNLDAWVAGLVAAASGDAAAADAEDSAPRLAHRLKGSSASLGAAGLAALCQRIEHVDELSGAERDELLQAFRIEAGQVAVAVRALLAGTPVSA